MDYSKIKVPYLGNTAINNSVDLFRKTYRASSIPIEIEKIIELELKISLAPVPNFQNFCDTDALITSNWQLIYVDKDRYEDERSQNRLRFSLAHEIGHLVLHKGIYSSFNVRTLSDFYRLVEQIPQEQYGYLESQANKFANYLLIPREVLIIEKKKALKKINKTIPLEKIDKDSLNSYLAVPISKVFWISEDAAQIALNEIDYKI